MTETRAAVLAAVAARIDVLPRPAVVAIDGVSAAGKTTFADELAQRVRPPAIRISLDDFHRPASERYAHGRGPDTYYNDTFDLPALRRGLDGVDAGVAAVVDGIFLLRPELADIFGPSRSSSTSTGRSRSSAPSRETPRCSAARTPPAVAMPPATRPGRRCISSKPAPPPAPAS